MALARRVKFGFSLLFDEPQMRSAIRYAASAAFRLVCTMHMDIQSAGRARQWMKGLAEYLAIVSRSEASSVVQ